MVEPAGEHGEGKLCKRKRKKEGSSCSHKGGVAEQEEKKTKKDGVRVRRKAKGER